MGEFVNARHCLARSAPLLLLSALASTVGLAAQPPAQALIYVGSSVPVGETGPSVTISAYSWATGHARSLSLYAGPHWDFLADRLGFEIKAGVYAGNLTSTADLAQPALNAEVMWQEGNLQLDWFNDVYWPAGAYSWLSGKYWFGPVFIGAMADSTIERHNFEVNAGPVFGAGRSSFDVGVAPLYSNQQGFVLRILVDVELADKEAEKPKNATKDKLAATNAR